MQVEKPTNPASQSSRFHRILSLAMTCGEFAKLTQGIYENYLDVKFKDPHLDSVRFVILFLFCNAKAICSYHIHQIILQVLGNDDM